jgi:hypothetical protein
MKRRALRRIRNVFCDAFAARLRRRARLRSTAHRHPLTPATRQAKIGSPAFAGSGSRASAMRKHFIPSLTVLTAVVTGLCSLPASALELDDQLVCKTNAHAFIRSLLDDQYIDPNPMRVEANSVNAFRPVRGRDLTAFGFRVYAVLGYQRDDDMFKKGSGKAESDSIYGAVVSGPTDSVRLRVQQSGSGAIVKQVLPFVLTAIVCSDGG